MSAVLSMAAPTTVGAGDGVRAEELRDKVVVLDVASGTYRVDTSLDGTIWVAGGSTYSTGVSKEVISHFAKYVRISCTVNGSAVCKLGGYLDRA